jgi:hypothetical protein
MIPDQLRSLFAILCGDIMSDHDEWAAMDLESRRTVGRIPQQSMSRGGEMAASGAIVVEERGL